MRLSTACLVCTLASVLLLAPLGGAAPRPLTLDLQRYDEYSTTVARVTLTQIEPRTVEVVLRVLKPKYLRGHVHLRIFGGKARFVASLTSDCDVLYNAGEESMGRVVHYVGRVTRRVQQFRLRGTTLSAIRNQGDSIAVVYGWNDMACADV